MSRESERITEVAGLLGQRLNSALRDVIPPEAQLHLLNAQRELLTALFLIYEHQLGARKPRGVQPARKRGGSRRARLDRIKVE